MPKNQHVSARRWLVTRHSGAIAWAQSADFKFDIFVSHLRIEDVESGDWVFGIMPIHMAERIISKGARFFALEMTFPEHLRGCELSAHELEQCGAFWVEYVAIASRKVSDLSLL